ncbi:MAG: lipid-A-disaccharide synthase [Candidatus Wallbacteria bacterium HGW-Wallbacteria-1]|jgi:lipid-A-disaccharide synthase|uniref:Lipid-A-disaccharide synthase n=1 Tax=Candidatus Wallbacteria bacterium HGW-Wallbacteria-1 TaxID=2013854 RepID=A0A2N1PT07_9BACT|nr:MAG: lipid-A-disaccharide synthase [Candidatus Wallbacteria bacterium HGW-Wallbacteria-1]
MERKSMDRETYRILLLTGEVSGDIYGAKLYKTLMERYPNLEIFGVGGSNMKRSGMKILFDSTSWGTIGIVEALKKAPRLIGVYRNLKRILEQEQVDCLVAIDYPGFNMSLVRVAKRLGIPTVFYFPPAKWARHSREVMEAARTITKVCATFDSTKRIYEAAGADVEFVGHPIVDDCRASAPVEQLRAEFEVPEDRIVVSLLPGSREKEVDYLLSTLLSTAENLASLRRDIQFVIPLAPATYEMLQSPENKRLLNMIENGREKLGIKVIIGRTIDVLSMSRLAVVASGTATLEAAYCRVPMVLIYKVSLFTELFAKAFANLPRFYGLPNLIFGKRFIPELIQEEVNPQRVTSEVLAILDNPEKYLYMKRCLEQVATNLGSPGANRRVADIIFDLCRKHAGKKE